MCASRKYIGRRDTRTRYPTALCQARYPGIGPIPLSGPLRGPTGTLTMAMPWRCLPDIPYTSRAAPGRVPLGIPTGTSRSPVTFSENQDKSAPPGPAGYLKTRFDHDHSARGPPGIYITAVLTDRTGPGLIVT